MYILSPDGRNALKAHLENLKDLREAAPYIVFHDLMEVKDPSANVPYSERVAKARESFLLIRRQVDNVTAVIKEFLHALDDQEILLAEDVGKVIQSWDFETVEPDETNPPV